MPRYRCHATAPSGRRQGSAPEEPCLGAVPLSKKIAPAAAERLFAIPSSRAFCLARHTDKTSNRAQACGAHGDRIAGIQYEAGCQV